MLTVMIDSDDLSALDQPVPIVATYSDLVPNPAELRSRLPGRKLLLIDRGHGDPSGEATIADVERGLMTVQEFRAWLERKQREGLTGLMSYCNRETLPALDEAAAGLHFLRWVATLDGTAHIEGYPPLHNPAAIQVIGAAALGIHADLSLVFDGQLAAVPEPAWLGEARQVARVLLAEIQTADGTAGRLATIVSTQH